MQSIVDIHDDRVESFNFFKAEAERIKNGEVNQDEFADFQSFLATLPRT